MLMYVLALVGAGWISLKAYDALKASRVREVEAEPEPMGYQQECVKLCGCSMGSYGPVLPENVQDFIYHRNKSEEGE
ncbi:hypothetical protein JCM19241_562 [Vibrio ishigakensis]|uniref:Uncharacterized protein n=1 Tax=Vibrio ishigakensis TaxID=1481914 RepID=A0A0B8QPE8_9VIBR|nr:hypothetical protein JCM19241_562 [Vibrio ishigakensis]